MGSRHAGGTPNDVGRVASIMRPAHSASAVLALTLALSACGTQGDDPKEPWQPPTHTVTFTELGVSLLSYRDDPVEPYEAENPCDDGRITTGWRAAYVVVYVVPTGCVVSDNPSRNGRHLVLDEPTPTEATTTVELTEGTAVTQALPYDEYTNEHTAFTDRFAFVQLSGEDAASPVSFTLVVHRDHVDDEQFAAIVSSIERAGR